jgi:hypothetical protein
MSGLYSWRNSPPGKYANSLYLTLEPFDEDRHVSHEWYFVTVLCPAPLIGQLQLPLADRICYWGGR